MIHLIGPGGAGKSTIGSLLAELSKCPFYDLDRRFEMDNGDIDAYIVRGYPAYANANVETYLRLDIDAPGVLALSSGFMTYPSNTHPRLPMLWKSITARPSTILLMPSLQLDECVAETIRRQQARPLTQRRTADQEEAVIRQRFPVYSALPVRRIATMRPPMEVAIEIAGLLDT
jgi:shikimate kinase